MRRKRCDRRATRWWRSCSCAGCAPACSVGSSIPGQPEEPAVRCPPRSACPAARSAQTTLSSGIPGHAGPHPTRSPAAQSRLWADQEHLWLRQPSSDGTRDSRRNPARRREAHGRKYVAPARHITSHLYPHPAVLVLTAQQHFRHASSICDCARPVPTTCHRVIGAAETAEPETRLTGSVVDEGHFTCVASGPEGMGCPPPTRWTCSHCVSAVPVSLARVSTRVSW